MSRKVLIQQHSEAGINFGKLPSAEELMELQRFSHKHVEEVVRDAIMQGAANAVAAGFGYTLPGSLNISIASGHIMSADGLSYDTLPVGDPVVLTLAAAHATLPRIDLIYARLDTDVQTDSEFRPFRRLRTESELELGVNPYPPTGYNLPTKEDTQAVVLVRQGTPNASPVAPTAGAGEVALYRVAVPATATVVVDGNVTDVRPLARSLSQANTLIDTINATLAVLPETVQDIVGALLAAGFGITVTYNDAGAVETISIDTTALDARYANVSGDTFTGDVSWVRTVAGQHIVLIFDTSGASGSGNGGVHFEQKHGSGSSSYLRMQDYTDGSKIELGTKDTRVDGAAVPTTKVLVGAYSVSVSSDLAVSGALSKGSGTFLIDHPLHPDTKDLVHAFMEAPRDQLVYPGVVVIPAGETEFDVDIDAASGMESGTFAALTQNPGSFVQCKGFIKCYGEVLPGTGTLRIHLESPSTGESFSWFVMAERADLYIKHATGHDANGHLIVERNKEPLPDDAATLLAPTTRTVHAAEAADPVVREEVVAELIGKVGYPRHAQITGVGVIPTREVTVETVVDE